MPEGYLALALHAHMPYVRHPEYEHFLEEHWFFEAITECYLPLLRMLERLEDDNVDYALLISLSPPLVTMFEDELLQERYSKYIRKLIALTEKEIVRTKSDKALNRLSHWYRDKLRDSLYWFETRYKRRLAAAFQKISSFGHLDLMTCAGTHGFLPLLKINPPTVRAQIHSAVEYHESVFGVQPQGMWLPECAYYPGVDEILNEAGIRYFFMDSVGLENAADKPVNNVYAPLVTSSGPAAFARDRETSYQVWAAEVGYPGHADYREYYRDVGHDPDLDDEYLKDYMIDGFIRVNTGIKYHRITRDGERKDLYDPDIARERAAEHAGNFMFNREVQIKHLAQSMDRPPLIVSPYDAELFGHWWYEGPLFLEYVFRKMCFDQDTVKTITPMQYLTRFPNNQVCEPAASSWGKDSTYEFWLNEENDDIYRDLHRISSRLTELVDKSDFAEESEVRILKQMARELMLAEASDWPFIMKTGTSPDYARKRIRDHFARFRALESMLVSDKIDEEQLSALEYMDTVFPDVDPRWYLTNAPEEMKRKRQANAFVNHDNA